MYPASYSEQQHKRPSRLVRQANWTTTLLLTVAVSSFGVFASSYAQDIEPVALEEVSLQICNHAMQLLRCTTNDPS